MSSAPGSKGNGGPKKLPARRIQPTHDYARQLGSSGPKDGWTKGPADPGTGPPSGRQTHPSEYTEAPSRRPDSAPPISKDSPTYSYLYTNGHKFGYGQPSKKERQPVEGAWEAPDPETTSRPAGQQEKTGWEGSTGHSGQAEAGGPFPPPCTSPPFVHLHVHSNFSFLDGGSRIEALVARAAELGQPALALTDHDGLYGAVRLAMACAKAGIKPIFGVEVRVESLLPPKKAPGSTKPGDASAAQSCDPHHLVLLAETREGYANLCRLVSAAHLADPDRLRPPQVTLESLREHREGLICLTGCRRGEVGYLLDEGRDEDARVALCHLRQIFGPHHLFVELQYFGYEPHQEAHAGQHGSPVYEKTPADGGRLRHKLSAEAPSITEASPVKVGSGRRDPATAATPGPATTDPTLLRSSTSATLVAYWWPGIDLGGGENPPPGSRSQPRPDLPEGQPRRLNPSDYDLGFYHDGRPWRLSCLTYCERLARLARACSLGTVLTTNAHYAGEYERAIHLVCRAAGHDQPLSGFPENVPGQRFLKSKAELEQSAAPLLSLLQGQEQEKAAHHILHCNDNAQLDGAETPDQGPLSNTWAIAQRCNVDLGLGEYHFPKMEVPARETAYSLLAKRCFRGIARKYKPVPPRAVELLEKELRMIQRMGFAHYFLVVHDIVRWARAKGVACSGRGSAGNSIVCHALDITASEPIRHHLLFERFLNPNRREMPDIDVDFCSARRDEVIEHIYKNFGEQNVAVVANVNTMSPRSAVRIVAEALGYAPTEINALAKHVPRHGDAARIREYLAGAWPELHDSPLKDESLWGRLLDLVEQLDSFPLHLGTHLGGFVITDRPITYYAPLQWAAKGVVVIQFNKDDVAALGLVKMDILGLKTHSAVSECAHMIRQRTGRRIRPYDLPPYDPAAYEIVSNGGSIGLFQLESAGQRNLASRLQERDFDDVIAAIALYRPGPLEAEMIGPFIDRRWGLAPVTLPHPSMAEAVADTYGVILYQEQVLRIAEAVAGFDLADADSLRRAMTRDRSREEMAKIGETFVGRAVERGVPEEAAREVFRQLEGFAAYGFNKSHSVCFAVISYATAWLKAYYPAEFLCAVLNNYPMGFYTPRTVLNDARRFGLEVRPLDVNLSGRGFTVEDEAPPDPWDERGYDPFAQAWTAEHDWGLTAGDLAELQEEQNGEQSYTEALRAALEQAHAGDDDRPDATAIDRRDATAPDRAAGEATATTGGASSGAAARPPAEVAPGAAAEAPTGAAPAPPTEAPPESPRPGDVFLPRAGARRAGIDPSACLRPSTGIAPDAAQALRVGFSYLKQMGDRSLDRIEAERRHGPFTSFEDFYLRTRIDYPVAENLIRVGAFDSLEPDRTELLWRLPLLHDRLEALAGSSGQRRGQLRAFFTPPSRTGLERTWSLEDKVRAELELMGLSVSAHPLQLYEEELRRMGVRMSYELPGLGDEVPVTVAGVYERAQNPWMRSGKRTMFLTLEDAYGLFECVCFESKLPQIAPVVARASYFLVRGRLQNNHKRGLAIVADEVLDLEEVLAGRRTRQSRAIKSPNTTAAATGPAAAATRARGDGRSSLKAGHPEALQLRRGPKTNRGAGITERTNDHGAEMPPIPNALDMRGRREIETYGDGTVSAKKRPPGAGTGAIPKKVG